MNNPPDFNELRVRVAELRGWTHIEVSGPYNVLCGCHPILGGPKELPDFPRDLNACAEFRQSLSKEQKEIYMLHLYRKVTGHEHPPWPISAWMAFWLTDAKATDHCYAFIATMEATSVRERNEEQPVALDEKKEDLGEPGGAK